MREFSIEVSTPTTGFRHSNTLFRHALLSETDINWCRPHGQAP
ncbi:hypothetical protein AB0C96_11205 [Streptomyces sp. NPDC048506]